MATLARFQATATDDAGNILTLPDVEVRLESTGLPANIFSDRAGTVALGNSFTGEADGSFAFHVAGGAYKITVTKGAVQRIWRYVAIGTMGELDNIYTDGVVSSLVPTVNDGAALGSPTKSFSDLYLALGSVINWDNGDVLLTHSANTLTLTLGNYVISGNISLTGGFAVNSGAITGRIDPRLSSAASGDVSPDISTSDYYVRTALAAACAINAPTGTPLVLYKLMFRCKDNGTARALNWNAIFRAIATVIPTTTAINKITYVACIYNATDTKWDVVAVNTEA